MYGVSFGSQERNANTPAALQAMADAGVEWVRINPPWDEVEASATSGFDFTAHDLVVNNIVARGMTPLITLGYTARWCSTAPWYVFGVRRTKYPPKDLFRWRLYVTATVNHYRGRVTHWEVWNEPDHQGFWKGSAAKYAELLAATYDAIKATDPAATVLLGGLATGGQSADPAFLQKILDDPTYPAQPNIDVYNIHLYGTQAEADQHVSAMRTQMARVGDAGKPLWVTETGYASDPAKQTIPGLQSGEPSQATWLSFALPYMQNQLGVENTFWFTLYDPFGGTAFESHGLLRADLTPKPALAALTAVGGGG